MCSWEEVSRFGSHAVVSISASSGRKMGMAASLLQQSLVVATLGT